MTFSKVIAIGAGPAGMACANTLANNKQSCVVMDSNDHCGGLCRTINFHGYLFDIGGHRFLTRSGEVNSLWSEILGEDLLKVKRLSRIYYRKKFFNYPLTFFNTFWNLGLMESLLCILSYLRYRIKPRDDNSFDGWITNRFGKRLFEIFFKPYTEKIWGMASKDISADWAEERIKGLSLRVAIQKALLMMQRNTPKTLSDEFYYPRSGPGEFYSRLHNLISNKGGQFEFNKNVISIKHNGQRILSIQIQDRYTNEKEELPVDYLFSSMPLSLLVKILTPPVPNDILICAQKLNFRAFIVVNVILNRENVFPDQWIYVHSPKVKLGRIQNYKNWSLGMVVDFRKTSLGLEYFCSRGDNLWSMNDVDLINFALEELEKIGIVSRRYLIDGFVIRQPDAYPVYSLEYQAHRNRIRNYLKTFSNFQTMGRGGLFQYGNSDYALLTGMHSAKKFLGQDACDIWEMNMGGY